LKIQQNATDNDESSNPKRHAQSKKRKATGPVLAYPEISVSP
jgi:hypothetical protein